MKHAHKSRGHRWRVQSDERGRFDEIVVVTGKMPKAGAHASGLILHAEMMNDRSCFVDVAGLCLWVHVGRDGIARITSQEDRRCGPAMGRGEPAAAAPHGHDERPAWATSPGPRGPRAARGRAMRAPG